MNYTPSLQKTWKPMNDEQRNTEKLRILLDAVQNLDEDEPDFYGELMQAGWNILHENPGTEFGDWVTMLMEQYLTEVVDAIGSHPAEAYASLSDMWDSDDYMDEDTGMYCTFAEWAEYFATDRSIELYNLLAEARRDLRRLEAKRDQNQ